MKQPNEHRGRSRIGRTLATAAGALLCVAALGSPNPAYAEHGGGGGGHGGGGGFHGGGGAAFHGGGGFHGAGFSGSSGGGGFAGGRGGGGGGFQGGSRAGFASVHNGFDRGGRGGRGAWWGGVGTYYPGGYDYPYDSNYDQGQYSPSATWYYCADPAGYYPYINQCYTGWQIVPAS